MEKPIEEKSPVAKMIDDLHEKFIRSQGDNGTFPKWEKGIKAGNKPPSLGDKNPNEKRGMKEEAGNYSTGGEALHKMIDTTDIPAPIGPMDAPAGPPTDEGPGPDVPQSQNSSLTDTVGALNHAPDTNYDFYGNTGSDQRAALYKQLLDQQRSPGNLIAQGIGGIGDAFSALGGKSTDFQDKARGISTENTANRIGAMDVQRQQKLQDLQGNQEAQLADPKSPMSRSIIASARGAGMNVGSLMPGNMVLKMMGPMADFALKKATIDMTGEHYKAEEANYEATRALEDKRIGVTAANQGREATLGAAGKLAGRGMFKRLTDAVIGDPGTQALEAQVAGGQPGQPMTATNSMGHKITSTDGGQTWQ